MSLTEQKFNFNELKWAVVLSYLHTSGNDVVKVSSDPVNFINKLTEHYQKSADFLRFLLWAREINEFFTKLNDVYKDKTLNKIKEKFISNGKNTSDIVQWVMAKSCIDRLGGEQLDIDIILAVDFTNVFAGKDHKHYVRELFNISKNEFNDEKYFKIYKFANDETRAADGTIGPPVFKFKNTNTTDTNYEHLFGATSGQNNDDDAQQSGGFKQYGGVKVIELLMQKIFSLPIPTNPSSVYKLSMGRFGIAVPISKIHYKQYEFAIIDNLSAMTTGTNFGTPVYTFDFDPNTNTFKLLKNGNVVEDSLIQFGVNSEHQKTLGIKIAGQGVKQAISNACSRSTGKKEDCLRWINNNIDSGDKFSNDDEFKEVNPRLVVELLDKLKWPWIYGKENGRTIKTYGTSFEEYKKVREKENDTIPNVNQHAKEFLEKCAKYINQVYMDVLNDGNLVMKKKYQNVSPSGKIVTEQLSYPLSLAFEPNQGISSMLKQINSVGMTPNIIARNNAYASLLKTLIHSGGDHQVLPIGYNMFNNNNNQNGGLPHALFVQSMIDDFYQKSIDRLIDALKLANKQLDQSSDVKIKQALMAYKSANAELSENHKTLRQYHRNNIINKDPKYNVSLEDMERFNKAFDNSVDQLNKSEIRLGKVIVSLQNSLVEAFEKKINENTGV